MFLDTLCHNLHNALPRYNNALDYLKNRGVSGEDVRDFFLGYSKIISVVDDGSLDYEIFMKETYRGKVFENKIIFPIYDVIGRTVGIFGRALDSKAFKYYLTQEAKYSGVLTGIYQALPHIYETGKVFVVEGPFDLLAFRKVFKNSVGANTAGLSESQYEILSFFADRIVTVFDSDAAGENATKEAKKKWGNISSVSLGYKDPDNVLKELGYDKFVKYVKSKVEKSGDGWML